MQKLILILLPLFFFFGCNFNDADEPYSLPPTDNSKYITSAGFSFLRNTKALEIYNCLSSAYGEGEHECNGTYSKTEKAVLNGTPYSDTLEKTIYKINIHKSETETTYKFFVDFIMTDNSVISLCYQWQYHNTNSWENTVLDGDIVLTDS